MHNNRAFVVTGYGAAKLVAETNIKAVRPDLYTDIANVSVAPVPGGDCLATRLQLMKNVFNAAKV